MAFLPEDLLPTGFRHEIYPIGPAIIFFCPDDTVVQQGIIIAEEKTVWHNEKIFEADQESILEKHKFFDAWRKLNPRIQGEDILMCMDPAGRPHKWNTFQQRFVCGSYRSPLPSSRNY